MREDTRERGIKITIDLGMVFLAYIFTYILKFEKDWLNYANYKDLLFYLTIIWGTFIFLEIPKRSWTYTSLDGIIRIIQGVFIATLIFSLYTHLNDSFTSIYFYTGLFFFGAGFCVLVRYCFMLMESKVLSKEKPKLIKALIVGAGEAGGNLLRESIHNPKFRYEILGIIDDDPRKDGMLIQGYSVLGKTSDIPILVKKLEVVSVIIATPSAKGEDIKRIYRIASSSGATVKILPVFGEILRNEPYAKQIREVRVEDLLGRKEELVNKEGIDSVIQGKTIFITGGGGSIGSELSRQIAKYRPARIINIDINENTLYFLELELKSNFSNVGIFSEICSIKDKEKLSWLFERYRPEVVFHTAAHKHVPLMESNPEEAVKNNVFGTKNLVECAHKFKVDRFLLISTDKAVNPTSVMGATKRVCEMILQDKALKSNTKYMAVRFGNVLGSKGSVVPIFKNLISKGKNITLTHQDITRYFMTIPEAVQLVIEAGSLGKGGEVFILDMGKPVKIIDLAKSIIELSGLKLNEDIKIDIIGLRPGEKLFEELLYDEDQTIETKNKKIYISRIKVEKVRLEFHLKNLEKYVTERDRDGIKNELKDFVKTYREPEHHYIESS